MATPKFLKKRGYRILICLLILGFLIALYFYFAIKEREITLAFLNRYFTSEISNQLFIIIPIGVGLIIIPFLINFLTTDLGAKLDEKPEEETKPIPVPVEIIVKTETSSPETKKPEIIQLVNSKFYPNNFIPDLKFFVGREKLLKDLEKKLAKEHRASIHDISGLGKTYTTYKFAEVYQNNYEKIFFVRTNKEEMLQSLAEIGVLLNPLLKDEPDQSKQANGFKNWLEENEKWLVIYDNVDIPNELKPFVPINKEGDCLFTSNFKSITNLGNEIKIEKLAKTDAKQLLFSRANNKPHSKIVIVDEKERKAFEKIIEEIDGHALSLNTTGSFISENDISFEEFERKLQKTPNFVLENEDGFDNYQRKSALKAFTIALDDISAKKANDKFENSAELAQKLLFVVSFIAPDNIPEILLQNTLQNITKIDFESEENEDLWQEIRRKSLSYDLLKYDKSSKLFNTHRLIQKVIQTRQTADEQKEFIQKTISAIDELFGYSRHETKENCELYTPHAIVLVEKAEKASLLSEDIARTNIKIGKHLRETVKYQDSITYIQKAIEFYKTIPEKEQANLAACFNELALVYSSQGRYNEAVEKYEEGLQISEKAVGKEDSDYAIRLNNLGSVYKLQGRYDEAIEKYEEATIITEKTVGKEHPAYAIRLNNLANVYKAKGKYDEAIDKFEEALRINEKTIGKEHPNYIAGLNNLATVYLSQSSYDEALPMYHEAVRISVKVLGENHPNTQTVKEHLEICRSLADKE